MKTPALLGILLALFCLAASPAKAASPVQENERMLDGIAQSSTLQKAEAALAEAAGPPPGPRPQNRVVVIATPMYIDSKPVHDLGPGKGFEASSGHGKGMQAMIIGSRDVTDWLTLSAFYIYAYFEYKGGTMVPESMGTPMGNIDFGGNTRQWVQCHALGGNITLANPKFGKFAFTFLHSWDGYDGSESFSTSMGGNTLSSESRDIRQRNRVLGLTFDYEYAIPITEHFSIVPYIGYNATHTDARHVNNFTAQKGSGDEYMAFHGWWHYFNAGAKVTYQEGLFSGHVRAGLTHMFDNYTVSGFTSRPLGAGAAMSGYRTTADTTATVIGAAVNYVVPALGVLSLEYVGMVGKRAQGHAANLALVIPF